MRALRIILLSLSLPLLFPISARAQDAPELQLFVRRNVGYSAGSQIQGSFRAEVTGPADLVSVTFRIDGQVLGVDAEPPFRVDFSTDSYDTGWHTFTAEGQTASGRVLLSNERRFQFVTAEASWQALGGMMLPLFGLLGLVALLVVGLSALQMRQSRRNPVPLGAPRNYGILGGTICPKCQRPFSRHWWGLNAGLGKLDRCDHCGKWSFVRALPLEQLRAAEAAELRKAQDGPVPAAMSDEERLRQQLDDSRYTDR